jgi:hypothetical protein
MFEVIFHWNVCDIGVLTKGENLNGIPLQSKIIKNKRSPPAIFEIG